MLALHEISSFTASLVLEKASYTLVDLLEIIKKISLR
jgi:hypothetical protein